MCHNFDLVAPKVEFTYKQKSRQGSALGGCISVLFILAAVVSGLLFMLGVMTQPDYTTIITTQYQSVYTFKPVL